MAKAFVFGTPPKRRGVYDRSKIAADEARRLDAYAGMLLQFQSWCDDRGISFRMGMLNAIDAYMEGKEE